MWDVGQLSSTFLTNSVLQKSYFHLPLILLPLASSTFYCLRGNEARKNCMLHQNQRIHLFQMILKYPVGTQRPKGVPQWSYSDWGVLDHNRTKIGCIRFLTYFGSTVSDIQLQSRKIEMIPEKLITSEGRAATDASLGVIYRTIWGRLEDFRWFIRDVLRT